MNIDSAASVDRQPGGISRRRFLTYALATPTLAIAVRVIDDALHPGAAGATPGVPDIIDLSDALTLAALPTSTLLVIEITEANRVVVHVPRVHEHTAFQRLHRALGGAVQTTIVASRGDKTS